MENICNIHEVKAIPAKMVNYWLKPPVELFKILKFEGIASSGAEAKDLIAAGNVLVNSMIETQKRKKMIAGDTIEVNGEIFRLSEG